MKTVFRKSVFATALILTSSLFVNCNDTATIKENKVATLAIENSIDYNVQEEVITRKPLVFITGFDKGNEHYYDAARAFFEEKKFEIVEDQYSVEEIINWLNRNGSKDPYGEIHIVNKSNPFKGMTLETVVHGEKVTTENLRENINKGTLPILQESVNENTKIIFHANGIGENKELMSTFRDAFCAHKLPHVLASPYFSIFNGEFSNHYLAKPHYVFYPTANSAGIVDLSKEIAKKYPEEKDINWQEALQNKEERFVGEAYTTQFLIPLKFELDYHNSDDEVPTFESQEELMDFIEQQEVLFAEVEQLKIPIEKFRWTYRMKNSTLIITGKSTGLVVLKPLIKPYGELQYIQPDTNNKRLYAMK
jgi:hypothetical protein